MCSLIPFVPSTQTSGRERGWQRVMREGSRRRRRRRRLTRRRNKNGSKIILSDVHSTFTLSFSIQQVMQFEPFQVKRGGRPILSVIHDISKSVPSHFLPFFWWDACFCSSDSLIPCCYLISNMRRNIFLDKSCEEGERQKVETYFSISIPCPWNRWSVCHEWE